METQNYAQFKLISTNRKIDPKHVEKIKKSIQENGYFKSKPISVNKDFEVIDGQHRLYAAKELGIPIKYEIEDVNAQTAMVTLNSTSSNWSLYNYIDHFSKLGLTKYVDLKRAIDNSDYGISAVLSIYVKDYIKVGKSLRGGNDFAVNPKKAELVELLEFFRGKLPFFKNKDFIRAVRSLLDNKSIQEKHYVRLRLNVFAIVPCANLDQYLKQFYKLMKFKEQS